MSKPNDYKLSSKATAEELGYSVAYFRQKWRTLTKHGLPQPVKQNRKSWVWSISEIAKYKQDLQEVA